MSQQAQAEGLNQEGLQRWQELQSAHTTLLNKLNGGEISLDAFDAEATRLEGIALEVQGYFDRAKRLNTISDRVSSFAQLAKTPALRRPLSDVEPTSFGDGSTDPNDPLAHLDRITAALHSLGMAAPGMLSMAPGDPRTRVTLPQGSRQRSLLNRYLRPAGTPARQKLTKDDMDFLFASRAEQLMSPYVDREGGYVTAEEVRNEIIQVRPKAIGLKQRVNIIATQAAAISWPTANVSAAFKRRAKAAGAKVIPTNLKDVYGKTRFVPTGADLIIKVPQELVMHEVYDVVGHVAKEIARIDAEEDEVLIVSGEGAGEPLGILTAVLALYGKGYTQVGWNGSTGFSGANIGPEDVQLLPLQLHANARANGVYLTHRNLLKKIWAFRTNEGGIGTGDFMFKQSVAAGAPSTLNGKELFDSEWFPDNVTAGSAGDPLIVLFDPDDYWWIERSGMQVKVLDQLYAEENAVGYQYQKANDGGLIRGDGIVFLRRQA